MNTTYEQRVRRALRRGKPIPPPPAVTAPTESAPASLVADVERVLGECAKFHREEMERLEGVSVSEIMAALRKVRQSYGQTLASARRQIAQRIRAEEQRHAKELLKAVRRAYKETADRIREAEQRHAKELRKAVRQARGQRVSPRSADPARPKPPRKDYPCVYRGDTPLTKKEKALFLDCRSCGPPVFRCGHPNFAGAPNSPAQYCTIYAPSKNQDVALCLRCELRTEGTEK